MHTSSLIAVLLGTVMLSACVSGPTHTSGQVVMANDHGFVDLRFNDHDRDYIREYYRHQYRALPPGLAKKGKIPPGHAKRLERHQPLPPGMAYYGLPRDLDDHLHRLPAGYVRVRVDQDIILMDQKTRIILDVIQDIDQFR